jgi:hypothetical protein
MPDPRYAAGVLQGIKLQGAGVGVNALWPDALPGYGPRKVGDFGRCLRCLRCPAGTHMRLAGTFSRYGTVRLCWACANSVADNA